MKVNIITAYCGGESLVAMTERMVEQIQPTFPKGDDVSLTVINNGAVRWLKSDVYQVPMGRNVGVARGFNYAASEAERKFGKPDYLIMINNDMEFPQKEWMELLFRSAKKTHVACPGVSKTATREAVAKGPISKKPTRIYSTSAYCWLIPQEWIDFLLSKHGFPLFDPSWGLAYGEDNWTALLWQEQFGPKPFLIEHRSWIKHLKAQSADQMTTSADRLESSRLLRKRISDLLGRATRKDLVDRCNWYLRVLQK